MVTAGALDKRVAIQQCAAGVDAIGQPVQIWAPIGSAWANIRHQTGAEAIRSGAETSIVKASIRIRPRAGITSGMRIVYGSAVYDIKAVMPTKTHVDLVCEVVNAQG